MLYHASSIANASYIGVRPYALSAERGKLVLSLILSSLSSSYLAPVPACQP
jgi:hypothetical protein